MAKTKLSELTKMRRKVPKWMGAFEDGTILRIRFDAHLQRRRLRNASSPQHLVNWHLEEKGLRSPDAALVHGQIIGVVERVGPPSAEPDHIVLSSKLLLLFRSRRNWGVDDETYRLLTDEWEVVRRHEHPWLGLFLLMKAAEAGSFWSEAAGGLLRAIEEGLRGRSPFLADALEEAGCSDPTILGVLRGT